MSERGQLYTLEGMLAGLLILAGLFFAIQATTATPATGGSLNPQAEYQDERRVDSILSITTEEQLLETLLYWDEGAGSFHCSPGSDPYYPGFADDSCTPSSNPQPTPPVGIGTVLDDRLGDAYSYNIILSYHTTGGDLETQALVFQGQPRPAAVRSSTTVILENHDTLRDSNNIDTGTELASLSSDDFYAPQIDADGDGNAGNDMYNLIHVEVVVWRA